MEIINESKEPSTRFDSIKWGGCLIFEKEVFMKMKGSTEAVRLRDGEPYTFAVNAMVQKVEAKVVIK